MHSTRSRLKAAIRLLISSSEIDSLLKFLTALRFVKIELTIYASVFTLHAYFSIQDFIDNVFMNNYDGGKKYRFL